ncbi:cyclic nucleotide-binding domain-containing protein [Luteibacter sp. 9135]|uniref:cyclic nucleotide-binding domain-containing protein n=1 Tax=Luteibacter sp. 9135 TaxID=1500893 RepID=UPI00068C7C55|nr:cyclic nucleotide-binding domain-containing protein [Luteibacter sp. 9135]
MPDPYPLASRHGCATCGLHDVCLPAGIRGEALARVDRLTRDRRTVSRGETLFRQGQSFHALYVLRSGATRSTIADADGAQQVIGFGLPGDILGVDGLLDDTHRTEAVALERSTVCEVPFARMEAVFTEVPSLHRRMLRVLGSEVAADQAHLVAMGRPSAVERVALFLDGLLERQHRISRQSDCLRLPMSRADIASYLGLAVETVSRTLGRMEEAGCLIASGRTLRILDRAMLASGKPVSLSDQKLIGVSNRPARCA